MRFPRASDIMSARLTTSPPQRPRWRLIDALIAGVALTLMLIGLLWLMTTDQGLIDLEVRLEQAPVTVYRTNDLSPAPVVVIAHGFSGSRQMMEPFARTLAHNGYVAVSFDFPGHGANPRPLEGKIGDQQRVQVLLDALSAVVDYASALPQYDGRLALLGHSMAGDIAVRYADLNGDLSPASRFDQPATGTEAIGHRPGYPDTSVSADGDVSADAEADASLSTGSEASANPAGPAAELDAIVAISPYLSQDLGEHRPGRTPDNLLFIYGEWEPQMILDQGRDAVAAVADRPSSEIEPNITYGDLDLGSARRLVVAENVEHIGVLYSASALEAALDWLNQVFDHQDSGWIDARGAWLGLYFLGVILLAWPLSRLLPQVSSEPLGAGLDWRRLLPAALLPALLTPLILRPFPSDFLSIAIADYIALHFAVYALLTGLMLLLIRPRRSEYPGAHISVSGFMLALLAVIAYQTLSIALPTDLYVAAFLPDPHRFGILAVLLVATTAWFVADEWLTRGRGAFAGGYALTKIMFLVSLILAVVLNLEELFFLVIIIPAILILFVVFGLFSSWIYRRTGHPLLAALANALAFAIAITSSFPIAD
ncbi:MAG: alpha/beta fold hydrolase [Chromatiaceae bacterium]|nr:alpha/beta fold hydrolase [Chromatiaceae bacterium]